VDIALGLVDVICGSQIFHLREIIRDRSARFTGHTITMSNTSYQNTSEQGHNIYLVEEPDL
jgi:hypothetical protein